MVYIYEYIWLDHKNGYRTKTKVTENHIFLQHNPGFWNFDGSSTEQADGHDSEVYIKPVRMCRDPFRKDMDNAFLVLCDNWLPSGEPHPDNTREKARKIFENEKVKNEETMFGIEQEFFFTNGKTPLGMKRISRADMAVNTCVGESGPQGPYYCGVGAGRVFGRKVAEEILRNALY